MSNITIQLPDERMQQLQKLAQEANVPPEELLRARVEAWLNAPSADFLKAAQYVLKKNEELQIAMVPIVIFENTPSIFMVVRKNNGRTLSTRAGEPLGIWAPNYLFVFCKES